MRGRSPWWPRWRALLLLSGFCWVAAWSADGEGSGARIPGVRGTTLAGMEVDLPDALKGRLGVLVVGFSKASQTQVSGWGRRLSADQGRSAGVAYFEMPMLAGAPKLLRGMIVHQMRGSVTERERAHFLPVTEDEAGWKAVARYAKPDDAYVLLVDGDGVVRWQTEGESSDAAYGQLKRELELLASTVAR